MKKKVFFAFVVIALIMVAGYRYLYKGHRDIRSEDSAYVLTAASLSKEFSSNPEMANAKYADMVIEVSGAVTAVDLQAHSVTLDGKMYATLDKAQKLPAAGQKMITVKGRFLGYDDLLEEFRMDQATITK